ncbi:MAG: chemotaxis response regulator protein-glutamate methylesterase [Aureliella sp.]
MLSSEKIKVLLCDDSSLIRKLIKQSLDADNRFEVVAECANGKEALDAIPVHQPEVIVMDVEMPIMDGVDAVRNIRQQKINTPIVMFSTLTGGGSEATLDALSAGANAYATKPQAKGHIKDAFEALKVDLIPKLSALAQKNRRTESSFAASIQKTSERLEKLSQSIVEANSNSPASPDTSDTRFHSKTGRFLGRIDAVSIGVSTGGPQALQSLVSGLPDSFPVPIFITQHMPTAFIEPLANRLSQYSKNPVCVPADQDTIQSGTIYLAPGDHHMGVKAKLDRFNITLSKTPPENSCRPAVDPMLRSLTKVYQGNLLSVILTGMGKDGLEGCRGLREKGGYVIAQDEATSTVWGMPGSCVEAEVVDRILPIGEIPHEITRLCSQQRTLAVSGT